MFFDRFRTLSTPGRSGRRPQRLGAAILLTLLALPGGLALRAAYAQDAAGAGTTAPAARGTGKVDAPMAVDWKFTGTAFADNTAAPVASEDTAFFASGGIVYAVDLQTGAQKWRYPSTGSLARGILFTPAYANGTLFISTSDGISALNAATGKLKYPAFVVPNGATTSPVVAGDAVYFGGANGRIFALNTNTGEPTNASYKNGVDLGTDVAGNMTTANGMLYVITANQVLHAVDALTGTQRWTKRVEGETRGATPIPSGENLYVAAGSALLAFRSGTGQLRWMQPTPRNITAPPAVDNDGVAYVVTSDLAVYAIASQGVRPASAWKVAPLVDYNVSAQPLVADDVLIVSTQGTVYAFDRATGALKWDYLIHPSATENAPLPVRTGISAHPIAVGDTVYTLSDDGTLTAFRHEASDLTPPTITPLRPAPGDYVNGQPPFTIRARLLDEGSGVNIDTIAMKLDDNAVARQKVLGVGTNGFVYDNVTGELKYTIYPRNEAGRSATLADGHHTVSVTVKDWMGNTATRLWTFAVDDTIHSGGTPGFRPSGGPPGFGGAGGGKGDGGR